MIYTYLASSNSDTYLKSVENILTHRADAFLTDKNGKNSLLYGNYVLLKVIFIRSFLKIDCFYLQLQKMETS